jgi:hypothetical protein
MAALTVNKTKALIDRFVERPTLRNTLCSNVLGTASHGRMSCEQYPPLLSILTNPIELVVHRCEENVDNTSYPWLCPLGLTW